MIKNSKLIIAVGLRVESRHELAPEDLMCPGSVIHSLPQVVTRMEQKKIAKSHYITLGHLEMRAVRSLSGFKCHLETNENSYLQDT